MRQRWDIKFLKLCGLLASLDLRCQAGRPDGGHYSPPWTVLLSFMIVTRRKNYMITNKRHCLKSYPHSMQGAPGQFSVLSLQWDIGGEEPPPQPERDPVNIVTPNITPHLMMSLIGQWKTGNLWLITL